MRWPVLTKMYTFLPGKDSRATWLGCLSRAETSESCESLNTTYHDQMIGAIVRTRRSLALRSRPCASAPSAVDPTAAVPGLEQTVKQLGLESTLCSRGAHRRNRRREATLLLSVTCKCHNLLIVCGQKDVLPTLRILLAKMYGSWPVENSAIYHILPWNFQVDSVPLRAPHPAFGHLLPHGGEGLFPQSCGTKTG